MLVVILTMKKLSERFTKKNCKRQIRKNLGRVIKSKGDNLYVKWESFDNSFNN